MLNYFILMPVSTSRVCWNRSSNASLGGERLKLGGAGYVFLAVEEVNCILFWIVPTVIPCLGNKGFKSFRTRFYFHEIF